MKKRGKTTAAWTFGKAAKGRRPSSSSRYRAQTSATICRHSGARRLRLHSLAEVLRPEIEVRITATILSWGKTPKTRPQGTTSPGPGAYQSDEKSFVPGCIMTGRHRRARTEMFPGPGQYDTTRTVAEPTTVRMLPPKTRSRVGPTLFNVGPGCYEIHDEEPRIGGKFSKASRKDFVRQATSPAPGPGAYQVESRSSDKVSKLAPSYSYVTH